MCHSIVWYYALCQHQDPAATRLIMCRRAFIVGYECAEAQNTFFFSIIGNCAQCRLNQLLLRHSVFRDWRREDVLSALNGAFQYSDEDGWNIDDSDADELDMETWIPQSPSLTTRTFAERAENRETNVSFHEGPVRTPTIVYQSSPHLSCVALVEYADDYADDEDVEDEPLQEPQPQTSRRWRSLIPRPTRLVRNEQNVTYMAFSTDDDMLDTEPFLGTPKPKKYHRTWRSWIPLPVKKLSEQ
ncbi:hypothetical protein DTO013E5_9024 [Penicillium roqueforti]|uniref:Uncharacterized protein n=1 Tax=Penicillium roqueforti (strain FM164) TaxID=1365484 RepID=W6PVV9_PENRF|nr:uncharacterized protein LCP9604111_7213 [Penicillium roqueforti]CDM27916.1 hypothetical protein PROQFM164_S01g001727 [Penicillium roqueforti FM164]KAF9244821.1 hypothetical protein LCP9604111_7213 [Penicillium roqueforti]KAI1831159.1 hypothetical protein CBS147337_7917 [Penicillium roqueforti]KAI2680903.1 hypothetical protein LCP963914a_6854 [Penicillium roqueforti]KAI2690554.1 hypothetical protein CBS147355_1005 [Penicillium roqueforti]